MEELKKDANNTNVSKETQSLRLVNESLNIARETVGQLAVQSEILNSVEEKLDDTQYMVDQSKRVVRGMTWSGWLYNMVSKAPYHDGNSEGNISQGFICPECKLMLSSSTELMHHYEMEHESKEEVGKARNSTEFVKHQDNLHANNRDRLYGIETVQKSNNISTLKTEKVHLEGLSDAQNKFLLDIEPQLKELSEVSFAIGNALDKHNDQLGNIDSKTEKISDEMRIVNAKATKLTNRNLTINFQFKFAIQEISSGKFVEVAKDTPILIGDVMGVATHFRAYTVGEGRDIWGFQHLSSRKFIGLNRLGQLKVKAEALNSYEHFAIDIDGTDTSTIFSYASYFGSGGWICMNRNSLNLYCIRGTASNKSLAAQFRFVKIKDLAT